MHHFRKVVFLCCIAVSMGFSQIITPLTQLDIPIVEKEGKAWFGLHQPFAQSGEPNLPLVSYTIILPPDAEFSKVSVYLEDTLSKEVPGEWDVGPVPPYSANGSTIWPKGKTISRGKDVKIYSSNAFFPASTVGAVHFGKMRKFKVAAITVSPFQYNPVTKKISKLVSGNLVVAGTSQDAKGTVKSLNTPAPKRPLMQNEKELKKRAVNPEMMDQYAPASTAQPSSTLLPAEYPNETIVIITTSEIVSKSKMLPLFIKALERRIPGTTVRVVQEYEWAGGQSEPDKKADALRAWLQANYDEQHLNISYAILIGNPCPVNGDVPMKNCWPRLFSEGDQDGPTDYYFAELSGDWNIVYTRDHSKVSHMGKYGTYEDFTFPDGGGPDQYAEIMVGRIPVYPSIGNPIDTLDKILLKTMRYQLASDKEWRRLALLPMVPTYPDVDMFELGEAIRDSILQKNLWGYYRLYDNINNTDNPPHLIHRVNVLDPPVEMVPCNVTNVLNAWNTVKPGLVVWGTHGSDVGAGDVFDRGNVEKLDDSHPAFAFQGSCNNAKPETPDNLASALLRNGCVVTIGATRISYIGGFEGVWCNGAGMAFVYSQKLVEGGVTAGDALFSLKREISINSPEGWANWLIFNIYGDPTTTLGTDLSLASYASDLEFVNYANGLGPVERDMSNGGYMPGDGRQISITGVPYYKGLGTHASSFVDFSLGGAYSWFRANVGIDDDITNFCSETDYGSAQFEVWRDGVKKFESPIMTHLNGARFVSLDVRGVNQLHLVVNDGGDGTSCDFTSWGGAQLTRPPLNQGPVASAGNDQTVRLHGTLQLSAAYVDDNLPGACTVAWSKVSGPGSVTFDKSNVTNPGVSFSQEGTYVLGFTVSDGQYSDYSTVTETVISDQPDRPWVLTATTISGNEVDLEWVDGSDNEDGFAIERALASDWSFSEIKRVPANYTTYRDATASPVTGYLYRVRAYNTYAYSLYSPNAYVTTLGTPAAPTNLVAKVVSPTQINLTWLNHGTIATNICIEKSVDFGVTYTLLATLPATANSYNATGLPDNTVFYFRAYAKNASGNSLYSDWTSAATYIAPPSNLAATAVSANEIDLTWTNNTKSQYFCTIVERADGNGSTYNQVAQVCENLSSYKDTGLTPGTSYTYQTKTQSGYPSSNYSNTATASTQAYTITASTGTGGSISPSGAVTVYKGQSKTFTFTPSAGYAVDAVTVDGTGQGSPATYTFSNVIANHTIGVTFKLQGGTLTKQTVSAAKASSAIQAASRAIDGNTGTRWESTQGVDPQWIRFDMGSAKAITVMVIDWETASAKNYTIEGSNDSNFATKTTLVTKTNMPSVQHRIDSLTGLTGSYRYYRMYGTARSSAWGYSIWEARLYTGGGATTYRLTTTTAGNGSGTISLNPAGGVYSPGQAVVVSEVPNSCSNFTGWSGAASGTNPLDTVTMDADKTVTATFTLKTYTITVTVGANGSSNPGTTTVNCGSTVTLSFTPAANYVVDNVTVDGVSQGAITSYTFTNVTANHTISATFKVASLTNLALNKAATASTYQAGNEVAKANDADATGTRWAASSGTLPQWWKVDLCSGESPRVTKSVSSFTVSWYKYSTTYTYKVEVSTDNITWTKVGDYVDATTATNRTMTHTMTAVPAQYVRITISGVSNGWASMWDFQVMGQ